MAAPSTMRRTSTRKIPMVLWILLFVGVDSFSSSVSSPSWSSSHAAMRELDDRLFALEHGTAPESLQSFYEPQLRSFSVQPGETGGRFSVTSTCYALQAILASKENNLSLYEAMIAMDPTISHLDDDRTPVQQILRELLVSDWRQEDLFQVPVMLYTALEVDARRNFLGHVDEPTAARIKNLIESVLNARPRRRDGLRQAYSDYIQFQCTQVYAQLYTDAGAPGSPPTSGSLATSTGMSGLPRQAVPDGAPSALALALARCAEISYNTLCREIALRSAGAEFDVMRLAYSLLTYVVATARLANTAGREMVPGEGPLADTRVRPVNRKLVQAGLAAFFAEQSDDGLWDKGQPIYRSFRKTGRNIGNAFIFAVDTVSSLLEHLPAEDFRPRLSGLRKVLDWIEFHHKVEILPDYCDPETGECTGKTIQGWSSPHLDSGPLAWSTAQTAACISRMKTAMETLMHEDVLAEFRGIKLSQKGASSASWDRLLDSDLGKCGLDRACTLKEVLEDRMISPRLKGEDDSVLTESFSSILFGPPGTAKTTIAQSLAERIGYDFLVIDTSEFLADGLTSVASRIRYVFTRLQALRRCVILLDEIEEFCLDRETPGIGMESRMLTTAMLTAINDLRRAEKSIFFVATNRLRAFDSAITRPGRFDMQLFVGSPNLEARIIQLRQKLADLSVDAETKHDAIEAYKRFLSSVWDDDAKYMNYIEGLKFAGACANVVSKGSKLTEETMSDILKSQTAVMIVRGAVRQEFEASVGLTRL